MLNKDEFVSYAIDSTFAVKYNVKHNIVDIDKKFMTAKMDHSGDIFVVLEDKFYIF